MTDTIFLTGMRFEGRHGVSDAERGQSQLLEVDLEVETDLSDAGRSDRVADTIDYGPLVELARGVVEEGSFRLLEAIAATIADRTLASTPARAVSVSVRKLAVPIDADLDHAGVRIRRERGPAADAVPAERG